MGHADVGTTMLYVHHTPQHNAADRLSALVTGAPATPPRTSVSDRRTEADNAIGEMPAPPATAKLEEQMAGDLVID